MATHTRNVEATEGEPNSSGRSGPATLTEAEAEDIRDVVAAITASANASSGNVRDAEVVFQS